MLSTSSERNERARETFHLRLFGSGFQRSRRLRRRFQDGGHRDPCHGWGCEQRRSNRILPLPSSAALPLIQLEMHRMATPPMRFEIP